MKKFSKEVRKELLGILTGEWPMLNNFYGESETLSQRIQSLEDMIERHEKNEDNDYKEAVICWKAKLAAFQLMKEAIEKALI